MIFVYVFVYALILFRDFGALALTYLLNYRGAEIAGLDNATPKPVLVLGAHSVDDNRPDEQHATHELRIRRTNKKPTWLNARIKAYVARFDRGSYSGSQFLHAVSHSVGAHTDALQPRADSSDTTTPASST